MNYISEKDEILIEQSDADFITIRDSIIVSGGGVAIKAVGYPNYATTHLSFDKVRELIKALESKLPTK